MIGGLKGSSILREVVDVSAVLLMSGCAVGVALAASIGRLNTEQSEQHWLRLVLSRVVMSELSASWQGMALCCTALCCCCSVACDSSVLLLMTQVL